VELLGLNYEHLVERGKRKAEKTAQGGETG
jgi:hypothetical protein